ncbi:MAG: Gfo/Idh/MocA family oxidoreductase [Bacteroidia bacterium]|nr:Gfo/Idh/MocA family oxidoreductase [Bacteroidia bacterium]
MERDTLRLGVIGMSDGNGHPYSWSAIFNGYDKGPMSECPFPVIPDYLSRQSFPQDAIPGANVTHVWTQSRDISHHIAAAARIPHVVDHLTDMIGEVDAVLLARDDGERHVEMALPFLDAGVPLYIDKPIALNRKDLDILLDARKGPESLFSCSALRYSPELQLSAEDRGRLGEIQMVVATVMKSWEKYAVHLIEPVLNLIGHERVLQNHSILGNADHRTCYFQWEDGIETVFITTGNTFSPLKISVFGSKGHKELLFTDSFTAFKRALEIFVDDYLLNKTASTPDSFYYSAVDLIEAGVKTYA